MTGIEVFKSAGTFCYRSACPVTPTRKFEILGAFFTRNWTIRTTIILTETDHQNREAVSSQQSLCCGRPRAQETGEHSPVRYKPAPKGKAYITWFQWASVEIYSSKSVNQERSCIRRHLQELHEDSTSWRLLWSWRSSTMGSCFGKHAKCWANLFWDKEKWIDALGRSTDKPRLAYCEDENGTLIYFRAVQGHSHGATINATLCTLTEIPLNWKEHIFHTGSFSSYESISEHGPWAGGLSMRSTRQAWNCEFVHISKHFTQILRHTGCRQSDEAVRWEWDKETWMREIRRRLKTYNWNIGKYWIVWVGRNFQDHSMSSVVKVLTWAITSLLMWGMLHAFAWTEAKDQNSIRDHVCSILHREGGQLTRSETRQKPVAVRPVEGKSCKTHWQQFIPTDTAHQRFCIRVVTTVVKLHPSQSLYRLDSVIEIGNKRSNSKTQTVFEFTKFPSTSRRFCDTQVFHEADGAVRWTHVLARMEDEDPTPKLEQRQLGWRTQSFCWQTQNGVLWGSKLNDYSHSCSSGHSRGVTVNQSNHVFFVRDTVELERTHIPHGQLFQLLINPWERCMGRRIKSKKHETSLFLPTSESARFVIATAKDRLERTWWWTKNGTAQARQSPRSRQAQDANLIGLLAICSSDRVVTGTPLHLFCDFLFELWSNWLSYFSLRSLFSSARFMQCRARILVPWWK